MGYIDYSLPDTIDLSPGLKAVGDALTEVMKRKQEREVEDRKYQQMVRTDKYNHDTLDERNRRDRLKFMMDQDAHNATIFDRARKAATPQESEAILNTAVKYDPETTKEIGRGKLIPGALPPGSVGPEPKLGPKPEMGPEMQEALPDILQLAPGMPPELAARMRGMGPRPTPPVEGPIPTAEEARRGAMARTPVKAGMFGPRASVAPDASQEQSPEEEARLAGVEQERAAMERDQQRSFQPEFAAYQADERAGGDRLRAAAGAQREFREKSEDYAEDQKAFPAQKRAYDTQLRRAELRRPYTMKLGDNDPGTTFDFETQKYAAGKEAAERFVATLPPGLDDNAVIAAEIVAGELASGGLLPNQSGAAFNKYYQQTVAESGRNSRSKAEIAGRADVARINLRRPIIMQGNADRRFSFDEQKQRSALLRTDVGNFLKTYKARTIGDDQMVVSQLEADLRSNNPARQRQAMIQAWQIAQHDHRVSNQDAILSQDIDPSFMALARNYISKKTTGRLDPGVQAQAIDAVRTMNKYLTTKLNRMYDVADRLFIKSPRYDNAEADEVIGQQLPGWQSRFDVNGIPADATGSAIGDGAPEPPAGAPPEVRAGSKGKKKVPSLHDIMAEPK